MDIQVGQLRPMSEGQLNEWLQMARTDESIGDLAALLAATSRPIHHSSVIAHTPPEYWATLFEPGKRNVGYTTWEADVLPVHWLDSLRLADAVCVPSLGNFDLFRREVPGLAVARIPHVRRHLWNTLGSEEISVFRSSLGIDSNDFVFYTVNDWNPRKNLPGLLRAYASAFQDDDFVTLVIKTSPLGIGSSPLYRTAAVAELAQQILDGLSDELEKALPAVVLLPFELSGRAIDCLHEIGDCYVSLSRGEGWGLASFDAASLGKPVVMTFGSGQEDFLEPDNPGGVRYEMISAPIFPPDCPSYWPSQRWSDPDITAASMLMREAATRPESWASHALARSHRICNDYAEPIVLSMLIKVLQV